jgi:methyl-accepting chemotaxis protein
MESNKTADNLIPDKAFSILQKAINDCKKTSESSYKLAGTYKMTPEGLANMRKANIYKNLQMVFSMIHYTMSYINKLSVAINKLPDNDEFNAVKAELHEAKEQVQQMVDDTKSAMDEIRDEEEGLHE